MRFSFFKNAFICLSMAVLVVSCGDVQIEDGQVPEKYLSYAKNFVGEYQGSFDNEDGRLVIRLDGQKLKAKFVGDRVSDLIGPNCNSKIGNLKTIRVEEHEDKPYITKAVFKFSPNECSRAVAGDDLQLRIKYKGDRMTIFARILKDLEWRYDPWCINYSEHYRWWNYSSRRYPYYHYPYSDGWFYCSGSSLRHYLKGEFSGTTPVFE